MKTTFVSTQAISTAVRFSVLKTQAELITAQKEVASGRWADVGLNLGGHTGQAVSLRHEHARLNTIMDTNGLIAARLDTSQTALAGVDKSANDFLSSLLSVRNADSGPEVVLPQAKSNLAALIATLNSTLSGQYIFSGINTGAEPVTDYFATPAAASKQSVDTAFFNAFGMTQSDPAVDTITAADMRAFLDTDFKALFDAGPWKTNWSSASDQNIRSRISPSELTETSANANEPALRKLAMAYTMVADLGTERLNKDAFQTVVDTAARLVAEATSGVTAMRAQIGATQNRVERANESMSLQRDIFSSRIAGLENVDPFEVSMRITALMTQLETAYALTARIQRLGLLKHL